ncbi:hypothetical protein KVP10_17205 [Candidimonas humi]|uniref:Uncharacterized protein n=1 Tax=Candidimonas humi TaxID=683355 RepID=A0ABV8P1J4_9BURK|nr:hypothetical protein [Candidimonas humi]MBV6306630.1 hypothetical protein [Candidimonas humi]
MANNSDCEFLFYFYGRMLGKKNSAINIDYIYFQTGLREACASSHHGGAAARCTAAPAIKPSA